MRYKTFHCYRNKAKKKIIIINDVSNGKFDFHFDSSPLVSGRDLKSSRGSVRTLWPPSLSFWAERSVTGSKNLGCSLLLLTCCFKYFLLWLWAFWVKMLMNNGPWTPEHIYQEIVGYNSTRHRGIFKFFFFGFFLPRYLYFSQCGWRFTRILANETSQRGWNEKWSTSYLWISTKLKSPLRLFCHPAWRLVLRKLRSKF